VLPVHLSANPEVRARFEREARAISHLNHPHICSLHDVGRQGDIDYLVMEYLEGETLADKIKRGPIPVEEALKIALQIAEELKESIRTGGFLLSEPVAPLPGAESGRLSDR
jgi:serine/threonine protein kinase